MQIGKQALVFSDIGMLRNRKCTENHGNLVKTVMLQISSKVN